MTPVASVYFVTGSSTVHRLDPRSKLVAAMALSVLAFRASLPVLSVATLIMMAVPLLSGVSFRQVYRALRPTLALVCLLFLLQVLSSADPSRPLVSCGPLRVTPHGCLTGLVMSWRLVLLLTAGVLLTLTTHPSDAARGMEALLRPVGVIGISSQDLALMLALALRFIPTISSEVTLLKDARAARGEDPRQGGLIKRIRALSGLVIPLCLAVFRRCDDLVVAMEARGYDGGRRSGLTEMGLTLPDWAVIGASIVAVASLCVI